MKLLKYIKAYSNNAFLSILVIFVLWRSFLFLLAWSGKHLLPTFGAKFPYLYILKNSGLPEWVWSFSNFDGVHYLRLAIDGYTSQYTQVFFPLYPLLIRVAASLFFENFLLTSLIISNFFFVLGLYFFSKLILLDFKKRTLYWALIFLLIFPTSFFFASNYTESLFFFLVVSSFYFARSGNFFVASILGGFASATRLFGLLLIPALFLEYYLQNRGKYHNLKSFIPVISILLVSSGFFIYIYFLSTNFGDPLLFWRAQEAVGTQRIFGLVFPPQVFYRYLKILFTLEPYSLAFFNAFYEITLSLIAICSLLLNLKRLRPSYAVFCAMALVLPILSGTLNSMPRYILSALFIPLCLSLINNSKIKAIIALVSAVLLVTSTIIFTRGYWIA